MTLPYSLEKHKIAFADAFETMTCGMPDSYFKIPTLEEKEFDQEGRLIERRFVYHDKTPKMVERYDYEKGIVHKSFYEDGDYEILRFTLPIYSEQELRAKHTPIKEWIQSLGFTPEQVTEIKLNIKSTDRIGGIQLETWHGCNGYFKKAYRININKTVYTEKGNIYAQEKRMGPFVGLNIKSYTFDAQDNQIFQKFWDEDTIRSIEVSLYDNKNRVIQCINTAWRNRSITHYTHEGNKVIHNRMDLDSPNKIIVNEDSKYIEKIGNNTCEIIHTKNSNYTDGDEENKKVTIFDPTGRVLRKSETFCRDKHELWKSEREYTYNEAGVLIKEVYLYFNCMLTAIYEYDYLYIIKTFLYNEQGQKIECNEKKGDKESLEAIGENLNLKFPIKDKIYLKKSLYYYNEQGDLIREDFRKWTLNEGIKTDIETFSIHHFYEKEEGYEAHLEVTVENN